MNLKILVCCHKNDIMASESPYLPIQVGKEQSTEKLGIQGDDTGENISKKNNSYCELTGMYWAWKNLDNIDYIGLTHYRRYFDFHNIVKLGFPIGVFPTNKFSEIDLSIPPKICKELETGKVIIAKEKVYKYPLYLDYCLIHISDDFRVLQIVIGEMCEQKYIDAFQKTMYASNKLSHFNMFIMSWKQFDHYCSWLFPILYEVEKRINIDNYTSFQKRVFGYMSERLLGIYIEAEGLITRKYPILWFNDSPYYMESPLLYHIKKIRNNLSASMIAWRG